jgi:hypothetical protein
MRLERPSKAKRTTIVLVVTVPMQVEQDVAASWCRWSEAR